MTRLTDERIAEIEKLATALLPRGDWLVFEVADVIGEFRGACKDLLAEVHRLQGELAKVEKERDLFTTLFDECPLDRDAKGMYDDKGISVDWCTLRVSSCPEYTEAECDGTPEHCWLKWAAQQAEKELQENPHDQTDR